jgi:hypothetical protein
MARIVFAAATGLALLCVVRHMQSTKGGAVWERPVRSLSPIALVERVAASAKIWLLAGDDASGVDTRIC